MGNGMWGRALILLGIGLLTAAPASVQERKRLNAISALQPGRWELRDLDNLRAPPRSICVADPQILLQVEHRGSPCSRLVVASDARGATVHYTCPSDGYGRTSVRVDSPRSAKIDTQGINDNMPFAYRAEARRVGGCRR